MQTNAGVSCKWAEDLRAHQSGHFLARRKAGKLAEEKPYSVKPRCKAGPQTMVLAPDTPRTGLLAEDVHSCHATLLMKI